MRGRLHWHTFRAVLVVYSDLTEHEPHLIRHGMLRSHHGVRRCHVQTADGCVSVYLSLRERRGPTHLQLMLLSVPSKP